MRRHTYRIIAVGMWVACLATFATIPFAYRRGIPLWPPATGTTRWVLGSGVLQVEHAFASSTSPHWPHFSLWFAVAGVWYQLRAQIPVGYVQLS